MAGTAPSNIDQQDSCLQANLRKAVPSVEGPSFHVTLACVKEDRKTNQCSYLLSFLMETPRRKATILPGNNKIKEDSNKLPTLSGGPLIFMVTLSATRDVVFTGITS